VFRVVLVRWVLLVWLEQPAPSDLKEPLVLERLDLKVFKESRVPEVGQLDRKVQPGVLVLLESRERPVEERPVLLVRPVLRDLSVLKEPREPELPGSWDRPGRLEKLGSREQPVEEQLVSRGRRVLLVPEVEQRGRKVSLESRV
jgi:hypothetical protein